MFCKKCGNEIIEGRAFCTNCGTPVAAEAPVQQAPAQQYAQPQYQQAPAQQYAQPQYQQAPQYGQQPQYGQAPQYAQQAPKSGFFSDFAIATEPSAPGPNNGDVDFMTAIKLFFRNYTNFKGRASKSEYWWVMLFTLIIGIIPIVGSILSLLCLVPGIAVALRRLHDTGKSGTYYFMVLIPLVGPILLLVQMLKESDGDNMYGPANPKQMAGRPQQFAQPQYGQAPAQQYAQPQYQQAPAQQYAQPQQNAQAPVQQAPVQAPVQQDETTAQ